MIDVLQPKTSSAGQPEDCMYGRESNGKWERDQKDLVIQGEHEVQDEVRAKPKCLVASNVGDTSTNRAKHKRNMKAQFL